MLRTVLILEPWTLIKPFIREKHCGDFTWQPLWRGCFCATGSCQSYRKYLLSVSYVSPSHSAGLISLSSEINRNINSKFQVLPFCGHPVTGGGGACESQLSWSSWSSHIWVRSRAALPACFLCHWEIVKTEEHFVFSRTPQPGTGAKELRKESAPKPGTQAAPRSSPYAGNHLARDLLTNSCECHHLQWIC